MRDFACLPCQAPLYVEFCRYFVPARITGGITTEEQSISGDDTEAPFNLSVKQAETCGAESKTYHDVSWLHASKRARCGCLREIFCYVLEALEQRLKLELQVGGVEA